MNVWNKCGVTIVRRPGPLRGAIGGPRLFGLLFVAMTKSNEILFAKEGKVCKGNLYFSTLRWIFFD
jgi:hypothetical protein